jgi:hypothetical protein
MSKSLIKFAKELFAPKVIADTLKNQNPQELGIDCAKAIKRFIINEFGMKGGMNLLSSMRLWLDQFYLALRKELDGED